MVNSKVSFIFIALLLVSCLGDEPKVEYPYKSKSENIQANLDENKISLFDAYMDAISAVKDKNESETFAKKIQEQMNDELKKLYDDKKYDQAILMAESLVNTGYSSPAVAVNECYRQYLDSLQKSADIFTLNELKTKMIEKKIMGIDDAAAMLKSYYDEQSASLFVYYFNEFSTVYPDLAVKHPELLKYRQDLSQYPPINFEKLMKSVVTVFLDRGMTIKKGRGMQDKSLGTGFFIDDQGHILTNHHVIADQVDPKYEGYSNVTVTLRDDPDTEIKAKVIGWDKVYDVALLKIDIPHKEHLVLGRSNDMKIGDRIYTIGNPLGLKYTVTSGIISNKEINFFQMGQAFQVDAAINPGNSGGPLIDDQGQVVGIVFAGVPQYQGISFAIPFEWVRQTIPLLYKGGEVERSWIGAAVYEDHDAKSLSFYYVMPGSGADKAGIQEGDKLVAVNGNRPSTLNEAQSLIAWEQNPGIITITIQRDGKELTLPVKTDKRPYIPVEKAFQKDTQANLINLMFGLKLELTTKMMGARSYKVKKIYKGLSAYSLDISEGDPVLIYGLKYYDKEKAVVMQIKYVDKDVASMEHIFTVQVSGEINTIL